MAHPLHCRYQEAEAHGAQRLRYPRERELQQVVSPEGVDGEEHQDREDEVDCVKAKRDEQRWAVMLDVAPMWPGNERPPYPASQPASAKSNLVNGGWTSK